MSFNSTALCACSDLCVCVCVCAYYLLRTHTHTHTPMSVEARAKVWVCWCLCYISAMVGFAFVSVCVRLCVCVCVCVCVCECDLWIHRHSLILPPVVPASFLLGPSNDTLPAAAVCITGTNEPRGAGKQFIVTWTDPALWLGQGPGHRLQMSPSATHKTYLDVVTQQEWSSTGQSRVTPE